MGSPDIRVVQLAWSALEKAPLRWISDWSHLGKQSILHPLAVVKELLLKQDSTASLEEPGSRPISPLNGFSSLNTLNLTPNNAKMIKVVLLSAKSLEISINKRISRTRARKQGSYRNLRDEQSPVIIYLHGGGFLSEFRSSSMQVASAWARITDAPVLYVDYSLAPEHAYPVALNECYEVYKWVAAGRLGIQPSRIVLVGDSTGGNLAVATCLRAIMDEPHGQRIPDAVVLAYPILNLRLAPTPSRSLFMMDSILPMNLLLQCRSVYVPSECDVERDACLSPVVASDALLKKFPPTSIMVGGLDPFLDDAVDFAHRLHQNTRTCRLKVYSSLPHSFLNFTPILPVAEQAVEQAAEWMKASFRV